MLGSFETCTAHYHSMKMSIEAKRSEYEQHIEELELARQTMETEKAAYDELAPNAEQENNDIGEACSKESENLYIVNLKDYQSIEIKPR